jgi:hypothetical protein
MKTTPVRYFGNSVYRTSRIMRFVEELAEATGKGENDFLFVEPYSIGDAVHTLGLLPRFREIYCEAGQRIILLCQDRAVGLHQIMPYADVVVGAALAPFELHLEYIASLYDGLTPHLPIVCAPDMHALGKVWRPARSPIDAKKALFFLEQHEPWIGPAVPEALRKATEDRLAGMGLERGGGLIVITQANAFDSMPAPFWNAAAALIQGRFPGLRIFTDTTMGGPPIEGTEGLSLNLAELIPAVEYAGAALVLRSGLADILAHAKADVVSVVPPTEAYKYAPKTIPQSAFHLRAWFPDTTATDIAIADTGLESAQALAAAFKVPTVGGVAPCT